MLRHFALLRVHSQFNLKFMETIIIISLALPLLIATYYIRILQRSFNEANSYIRLLKTRDEIQADMIKLLESKIVIYNSEIASLQEQLKPKEINKEIKE